MSEFTVGSLFSGIGGFDLGFERAGFAVKWQVEIDPFCRRVLAKHWPDVLRHDDVKTFPPTDADEWRVDVICGGFPCQDISVAGRGDGIDGERSGLWSEYARIVRVVRPRFVVVENVSALLGRGLGRVLGDLAACGYDAEWDCIPACAVGAPHRRDRLFLVAYPHGERRQEQHPPALVARAGLSGWIFDATAGVSDPEVVGRGEGRTRRTAGACSGQEDAAEVADADGIGRRGEDGNATVPSGDESHDGLSERNDHWGTEPSVGRVADGVPSRVDRLRGLGNAVVPQVSEWIARRLLIAMRGHRPLGAEE